MAASPAHRPFPAAADIRRLLVVVPNWVGDAAMATPTLAALRTYFAEAEITHLMRPYVHEVLAGGGWSDHEVYWPREKGLRGVIAQVGLVRRLRRARFDGAILLTNAFRSAWVAWRAGIRRRIGYARDGRGWLLTHKLNPRRERGRFVPTPLVPYYAQIAEHCGATVADLRTRLVVNDADERAAAALRAAYSLPTDVDYAVIAPGAAFGAAKCWLPERFAEVCDGIAATRGWRCLLVGAPGEFPLLRAIRDHARHPVVCCEDPATTLGSLKALIRDARVLIGNDSGPRHFGVAVGTPTVTVFGPTHQEWTRYDGANEVCIQIDVDCGPCQLRKCPLDHRCMTGVTSAMVLAAVDRVVDNAAALVTAPAPGE